MNPIGTQSFKIVQSNGNGPVPFNGLVAKYSFELATSFTELRPGENVTVRHDRECYFESHLSINFSRYLQELNPYSSSFSPQLVSKAYEFDSTGAYDITPAETRFWYRDATTGQPTLLVATVVTTYTAKLSGSLKSRHLERRKARANQRAARSLGKRGVQIENCSGSSLQDQITLSAQVASLYVADAEKYLSTVTTSSQRYMTWFGTFAQSRHDTVLSHFTNIRSSNVKTYTFDCACTESSDVFAYVFPNEFGHIYLCDQYILANVTGSDSKAGTIVHESTHFTRNAGTLDITYGKTNCQALAISNATAATMNADSHEYFAENSDPTLL